MKITILNGNPQPSSFDTRLAKLENALQSGEHNVSRLNLREMPLRYCVGCFGCWVKTPGECVARDASHDLDRAVIHSDFVLWATPLKMGFPSALLKMALDKHLPLIHPYMEMDQGEVHHLRRYPRSPRLGLLVAQEASTDERDLQITTDILTRTALNFKTRLEFALTSVAPVEEIAARITETKPSALPLPPRLAATAGSAIQPPKRLAIFNGSPRGRRGNTPLMLEQFAQGFLRGAAPDSQHTVETYHLVRIKETEQMAQAFEDAECAIIGFPLYTDAMPGVVKHFIEALEPLVGRPNNPALGFLVQSGFPEALHSRYVERYLEKLAARLGSPYLGSIVKGGGEGTRMLPINANRRLFENLRALGAGLAAEGRFDPVILQALAKPESYPRVLAPMINLLLRIPIMQFYFDSQMKANQVYEQRFAQPFAD
jgi:multimeric flavodoxin WrbA